MKKSYPKTIVTKVRMSHEAFENMRRVMNYFRGLSSVIGRKVSFPVAIRHCVQFAAEQIKHSKCSETDIKEAIDHRSIETDEAYVIGFPEYEAIDIDRLVLDAGVINGRRVRKTEFICGLANWGAIRYMADK